MLIFNEYLTNLATIFHHILKQENKRVLYENYV